MRNRLIHFAAPLATIALLAGMTAADKLRIDPREADAFHTRAAAAISSVPKMLGNWYAGKDIRMPEDAQGLLKPNGYLDRLYLNLSTGARVEMLFVQCRDTRDMQGHYPPVCYPSHGCKMNIAGDAQTWKAADLSIPGTEYTVAFPTGERRIIRNFFVLPSGKIVPNMESVNAAAKDYRELVFGVTQIQLLFDATLSLDKRDAIFAELIGPNENLIQTLRHGGIVAANAAR
jgi:hypothetical protein